MGGKTRLRDIPMRSIFPNLLTLLAICSGLTSIRFAIEGRIEFAVAAIILAGFLDGIDGRVARFLKSASRFGEQMDSLADFVNFGVAPAMLLYFTILVEMKSLGWIAGLLVPPAAMSAFAPVSAYGLAIYVFANTFVNLAGHANAEANPFAQRSATWLTHPWVYHALHHARFKNHYSFASSFMDRLFGTEWSDWPALHARVVAGQPLESLSERGD